MATNRRIELYDRHSIKNIQWPKSEESEQAQQLPLKMLELGVENLITNIQTDYLFLKVDDFIFPITVNNREYNNSYLTSNYYPIKEMRKKMHKFLHPFVACAALIFKMVRVNRTVIVNNWLLSSSLYPDLTEEQIELMTNFLKERFPDHLIMLRSLNEADGTPLLKKLKALKYHTFYARQIFYYDPSIKSKRSNYHRRRDEKAMTKGGYEVGESSNYKKLIELFNRVYKDKHTIYCPHYTEDYLKQAVETEFLKLVVLKQGEEEVGVFGYTMRNGTMIVPFFGYDISAESHTDIYRILTMLVLKKAEELNVHLNDGSGGEQAKTFRGMKPFNEYAAIYAQHLPIGRKLFWKIADTFSKSF